MLNWFKKIHKEKEAAQKELDILQNRISYAKQDVKELYRIIEELNDKKEKIKKNIEGYGILEEIGYNRYEPTMFDERIEAKIADVEENIAEMLGNDTAIVVTKGYRIDGSESKGEKFQKNYGKNLLTGFNVYVQSKIKSVKPDNYKKSYELIKKSFEKYNKQGALMGIIINQKYYDCCIENLTYTLELKIKKDKEKELLRIERNRMKEQERLLVEAKKEKERLEKEIKDMNIAYAKALTETEREKIKSNISKLDKRLNDIDFRVSYPKAGWVYIIHSSSLPGMIKIGTSRRLNGPYTRIAELSSSSLPTPFVLDGFCFSEDAFAIEYSMHEYFNEFRVSPNREFFYVEAKQAIDVLKNVFGQKVISGQIENE